jgi:hypothetical protein
MCHFKAAGPRHSRRTVKYEVGLVIRALDRMDQHLTRCMRNERLNKICERSSQHPAPQGEPRRTLIPSVNRYSCTGFFSASAALRSAFAPAVSPIACFASARFRYAGAK